MDVPVLLIVWRRPDTLRQLIQRHPAGGAIALYVACDGPNPHRPGEEKKVAATRAVIESEIDWPCHIERFYSEINHGCRLGVSRAITWFFERVEEGIILEDDCIPHPDFFPYCASLLELYRNDTRIWSVCGSNFQLGRKRGAASYYFSIHGDSWGWATWRRAWLNYSSAQAKWPEFRDAGRFEDVFPDPLERLYWTEILDRLFLIGEPSAWDYQWWLACWMNNALHAWPNVNLVTNSGFTQEGTHTLSPSRFVFAEMDVEPLGAIIHPEFVLPSRAADRFAFRHRRSGGRYAFKKRLGFLYPFIAASLRWVMAFGLRRDVKVPS